VEHLFQGFQRPLHGRLGKMALARALTMSTAERDQLSTIERIECALVLLAYFIELDGDVHVPMYEKFETELE
jgi:hypothetical protein